MLFILVITQEVVIILEVFQPVKVDALAQTFFQQILGIFGEIQPAMLVNEITQQAKFIGSHLYVRSS